MEEIITSAFPFNLDTALNPAENEALPDFGNSNPIIGSTVGSTDIANTLNSETLPLLPTQIVRNSENIDTTLPIIQSAENSTNAVLGDTDPLTGIAAETTPFVGDLTETTTATITATASGSQTPPTATRPETVINGDFEISSNNDNAPEVGDGLDERTFWTFDFTQDPEVLAFQRAESITEAKLTLELKVIGGADTDTTGIEGSTKYVDSLAIRDLPPNEVKQITINLLDTYTSEEIIGALQGGEFGKFRMYYDDDAIVSGASLELSGEISPIYDTGVFTVDDTGQVTTDFLFDGNNYEGELALFSLEGMEALEPGSTDFIKEAASRALQNSPELGHIIISDATEGAKFSGATQYEGDFNNGEYLGSKTFEMNPGTRFAVMLVPDSTVQDTSVDPDVDGVNRALFSVAPANPDGETQFVKVLALGEDSKRQEQGETFAFEDIPINRNNSDKDFNDLIFQVEGATGKTTLLDEVINPERDWRESKIGEEIIQNTIDPEDLAGNTPNEARKSLPSTSGKTYSGWVSSSDTDDYYSFSLGASNEFNLSLDGLSADANVEVLDVDGNIVYSSTNTGTTAESISGTLEYGAYRENVVGSAGDDQIIGNQSSNTIFGEEGKDSLEGEQGDDKLIGGIGADILDGGEDNDTASYFTATNGVTANLTNSQENTGDAQGDVFQSIENLEGSEFGDRLIADIQNNDIRGLGGNDSLDGLAGDDTMSGGTGNDTYKVENVNDVVIENINQGIDTVDAAIDYILGANLENLNLLEGTAALNGTGNELNNIINGNSGDNVISGGDGDDSITGGLGNESSVPGSLGKINGTPGSDILTGGNGNDAFIYNNIADSGDLITDFTVGDDKIDVTNLLQSLGYAGSDPITDGFLGFKQASDSLAVLQIDPDGAASNLFRPVPFVLLDNVSVAALNNSSNFVF